MDDSRSEEDFALADDRPDVAPCHSNIVSCSQHPVVFGRELGALLRTFCKISHFVK